MPSSLIHFRADRTDLGFNSQSARNLAPGEMSDGNNVRFERGSGVFGPVGYRSVYDSASEAIGDGAKEALIFPALWIKTGTKVEYAEDPDAGTFYDTGLTLTTDTDTWFEEQGNGDVHLGNVTDAPVRVAIAKATVAIADTDTTITVGANQIGKFAASGTVRVNGDAITYSGKNATQLTGCASIQSGGHVINSLVIQTTNPSTFTEEKGSFAFEFQSRLVVGGRTDFENILYASAPEDANNPEYFYDFDANGPVSHIYQGKLVGGVKGIGRAFVFMTRQVHVLEGFDVTTGAFLTQPISEQYGAYNQRCIVDMDGVVAFLGNKRLIPISIQLTPNAAASPYLDDKFDHRLRPWLEELDSEEDQADAHLHYDHASKILKISARRNGKLETRCYDRQNNAFLPEESRPGRVFTMFKGKSYFIDSTGEVHKDDTGRTNNSSAILTRWATGRMEYDKGRQEMQLYKLIYQGFMTQGCEHTLKMYIDGSSLESASWTLDDSYITSSKGVSIGDGTIGTTTIGGDVGGAKAFPYTITLLLRGYTADDVKLEWSMSKNGHFLSMNSYDLSAYLVRRSQDSFS